MAQQAGLFGGMAPAALMQQQDPNSGSYSWAPDVGMLGAALKDASAYLMGKPQAADNVANYMPLMRQLQMQQFYRAAMAPGASSSSATMAPASSTSLPAPQSLPRLSAAPVSSQPNAGAAVSSPGGQAPQIPPSSQSAAPQPSVVPQSSAPLASDYPTDFWDMSDTGKSAYLRIPHIAGMPAKQAVSWYLMDPNGYTTEWAKQFEPTDLQKNAAAAFGQGSPGAMNAIRGNVIKGATSTLRPGGGSINYADDSITTMPSANGVQTLFPQGAGGPAVMQMVPGAAPALAASSYSTNAGKNAATPAIGYGGAGMPVATNKLNMTGNPNVLGLPGQTGLAPQLPRTGQNNPPPAANAPSNAPGALMPQLPANQGPYMQGQGKAASDRHEQTIEDAQGSPDRVNVLDNIINLSQGGVNSGPGSDFQNKMLGYVLNTPIGQLSGMATLKDNVAKFQELQKFLLQNGQRAWQSAGGTGTDAQLVAASHANPNDAQFPQALQTIAKWVKAGELGIQAKANAQDKYLSQNGNTAQNQISFENSWRNAMDRRVFQLQAMSPNEQQAYIKSLSPSDAATIRAKRQQLMSLGAIQ